MRRKLVAVFALFVLCAGVGRSQEVPPELVAEPAVVETAVAEPAVEVLTTESVPAVEAAPWWLDYAESGLDWVFTFVLTALCGYLMKKAHDNAAMQEAVSALEAGIQHAWVNYAKALKKGLGDGKWTDEEKAESRAIAKRKAIEVAKGAGKRLLLSWAKPRVDALISRLVERRKADKTAA